MVFFSFGAIRPVAYGESCIRKVGNESSFQCAKKITFAVRFRSPCVSEPVVSLLEGSPLEMLRARCMALTASALVRLDGYKRPFPSFDGEAIC